MKSKTTKNLQSNLKVFWCRERELKLTVSVQVSDIFHPSKYLVTFSIPLTKANSHSQGVTVVLVPGAGIEPARH